jgi:CubicO group peptidase (beta-lactamase class C family)
MIRTAVAAAALAVAGMGVARAQTPPPALPPSRLPAGWEAVRDYFISTAKAGGVVGGAIALVHGDTLLAFDGFGDADRNPARPVDANTIWHWASVTKTFTAIAILQLRDRGRLSLDDPIVKYVPELRAVHDTFGSIDDITIRQLLSHSAGFRNPTWPWGGDQPWHPFEPTEWSQLVAMMPYTEILFAPGSKYSYSNPGVIFLGRVIEKLSGDDYEVYVEKNILRPLGMSQTYYDLTPYDLLKYRSNSWVVKDGAPVAQGLDFDTGITTSNGGLNAPIPDMAKYLGFLAGDGSAGKLDPQVLARTSLSEMWTAVLPVEAKGGIDESVGLGFFIWQKGNQRVVGHTGSQRGFRTFIYLDPSTRLGVIGVINTAPADEDAPGARPNVEALQAGVRGKIFADLLR